MLDKGSERYWQSEDDMTITFLLLSTTQYTTWLVGIVMGLCDTRIAVFHPYTCSFLFTEYLTKCSLFVYHCA